MQQSSTKRGKRMTTRVIAAALVFYHGLVCAAPPTPTALPTGAQVTAGQASVAVSGAKMDVNQAGQRAIINWQTFNIGSSAWVNFNQPNAQSVAMNRVLSSDPSAIYGRLTANGQIFLLNPSGVLFGPTARVDVGGMVATTLKLADSDFLTGKYRFMSDGNAGSLFNQGSITATERGYIALLAPEVRNEGIITARMGTVAMAAGDAVSLDLSGDGLINFTVDKGAVNALIENKNLVQADGGQVLMSVRAADDLTRAVVNNEGIIQARGIVNQNGRILLDAGQGSVTVSGTLDASSEAGAGGAVSIAGRIFDNLGTVRADGTTGGSVAVAVENTLQAGSMSADGASAGGTIAIEATGRSLQTEASRISADSASGQAGTIKLAAGSDGGQTLSGAISASGAKGGAIQITGGDLNLAATTITAIGTTGGGTIRVGGDLHGANPAVPNSKFTTINHASVLDASATEQGDGGTVAIWSDGATFFTGTARAKGGSTGSNGGLIEVSGKGSLAFGGSADASAPAGAAGTLLLDPKNIIIDAAAAGVAYNKADLLDPNPAAGDNHGNGSVVELAGGNILVTSPSDSYGGKYSGAAYLYDGKSGALISALHGGGAYDQVGSNVPVVLTNGNYVLLSPYWSAGKGAATWGSGTTGVSGAISASNSLAGSAQYDNIGMGGVTALTNGNYVVNSAGWNGRKGAVTWGDGTKGVKGTISASNSLVGSNANDSIGGNGVKALTNGNYVVLSPDWSGYKGAVTWGDGTKGVVGQISASNSLVGSAQYDSIGGGGATLLANGNYVVLSQGWSGYKGAVTWGSGATGISGVVSASNSLVGSAANDYVGSGSVTALTNGNYVVASSRWNGDTGAVTWGDGTKGISGMLSATNSLVGSAANDKVGSGGATALTNGNYVVASSQWSGNTGAVTWGDGTKGISGVVSASNSLVGSAAGDNIGGSDQSQSMGPSSGGSSAITALTNGNYVVASSSWSGKMGAVTWGDGTKGISGVVSASNSLVGSAAGDNIGGSDQSQSMGPSSGGSSAITALTNGNYVVASSSWSGGKGPRPGATAQKG